jgi:signal transduction histidine kinase/CheY-like chemotaxis protein
MTTLATDSTLGWQSLPRAAQLYVATVIVAGMSAVVAFFPLTYPRPLLFACLLAVVCLTAIWKVNLPIPLASGATLSVLSTTSLATLLLLGAQHAVFVDVAGAWVQCTCHARRSYPWYRTVFSTSAHAITMATTALVYGALGGLSGGFDWSWAAGPVLGATATYFFVNTGLVAGAIALSTGRTIKTVWCGDFLWSGLSFMMAGVVGAAAAAIVYHGEQWKAVLMLAPVYLTYRTYHLFAARLEKDTALSSGLINALSRDVAVAHGRLHDAVEVLLQVQVEEKVLATEKGRLDKTVAEMARLQETREQLLEREKAARASAERANRQKDEFLATVSHELRTPLQAILGWADMLRNGALEDARRDRACHAIYTSARRQAHLVNELLDVARIMSGKLGLDLSMVDLKEVLRAAVETVQPDADAKRIDISVDEDPSLGVVHGDGVRLQQVASNIIGNAVKFTPEGGAVHVRLHQQDDCVEMVVTDTGRGIAREFLPMVFEPFRQADEPTTRPHEGLGLGLSIVKQLVEAHGGSVTAESDGAGHGATLTVRLPTVRVHGAQLEGTAADRDGRMSEPPVETTSLDGIAVLVVDDDDESRHVIAAFLEDQRATVLTAASAAAALDVVHRERVDVLLADVGMPGQDGYTLIRQLRASKRPGIASIPAAALTGFARAEDREQALEAGFQLHLAKPVDPHALIDAAAKLGKAKSPCPAQPVAQSLA